MRLLLDSQVLVWQKIDSPRLPLSTSDLIESDEHSLVVSLASFWELTVKESLGKLEIPDQVSGLYADWISTQVAQPLPVDWNHIRLLKELPPIHRDPFDRILVAQALVEDLTLVSCDENIRRYPGVKTLW